MAKAHQGPPGRAKEARKQAVLTHQTPSIVQSIADALVIKNGDLFFVTKGDGSVPLSEGHGFGLYYHDCRFLNGYELTVGGLPTHTLAAASPQGFKSTLQLTNPRLCTGGSDIDGQALGITWSRLIHHQDLTLYDVLAIENFDVEPHRFALQLKLRAEFEDIFDIRGLLECKPGRLHDPVWDGEALRFRYDGADGLARELVARFDRRPARVEGGEVSFEFHTAAGETLKLLVSLTVVERPEGRHPAACVPAVEALPAVERLLHQAADEWIGRSSNIRTDEILLDRIVETSMRDLHTLRSRLDDYHYFAAGVPWFATLFGRDSAITAMQMLAFDHRIAEETLRLLAHYQGTACNDWRDEQPGKILHELRVGELAHLDEIPHTPYYGSVDSTPLFLLLVVQHAAWAGSLALFHALKDPIERALHWIDAYGDTDGDGFIDYRSGTGRGLINQGWKDSGNAIVDGHGHLATPPIALVEVQAYVYAAKLGLADLYERDGDAERGKRLRQEAESLRERFLEAFWLDQLDTLALALEAGGKPCEVVASNAGHALWAGIVDQDQAERVAERLMAADMFSGWGVRTLSQQAQRYNPVGYHIGTVWPHDNALIAAGMRRYGLDEQAERIFNGIFEAATHFDGYHMPEVFSGYPRAPFGEPVRYPVACHPQAWAAGAIPYLLQTMLGLVPEGFERRLRVIRPRLPHMIHELEITGVRVASAKVDLRFERRDHGMSVRVLRQHGELDVLVSQCPSGRRDGGGDGG